MRRLKGQLKGGFARSVMVLVGGTALAQALGILALPLLTRIYDPADFGLLALFSALLGMISVIASFRYQIAIPLPEHDKTAANLLALSLICLAGVTAIVTGVVYLFSANIAVLMQAPSLAIHLWLLPIAVAATGAYGIFQFWATRKKAFSRIARTRIEQSVGGVSLQLIMGWAGEGALGLIVGQIVNNGAGFFGLAWRAYKDDHTAFQSVSCVKIKSVAREYDRFPKYSTLEALTNTAGIQLPVILIASLTTSAEVGYLMLAMRIMQAPMSLVGSSISQVYFSRAVEEHRNDRLGEFTANVVGQLAKVGVGPLIFVGIISPTLFGILFGLQWARAGELVAWMTPWFVLQFLASPISMSLHVTANQRKALILTAFGLLLRVSLLYVGAIQLNGHASESFAVSGFIFYLICLCVFCNISNVSIQCLFSELKMAIPIIVIFALLAICLKTTLSFLPLIDFGDFSSIQSITNIFNTLKNNLPCYFNRLLE